MKKNPSFQVLILDTELAKTDIKEIRHSVKGRDTPISEHRQLSVLLNLGTVWLVRLSSTEQSKVLLFYRAWGSGLCWLWRWVWADVRKSASDQLTFRA